MCNKEEFICAHCGSTNVLVEAIINPNTKEVMDYPDNSLNNATCSNCDGTIISYKPFALSKIKSKYLEFTKTEGKLPTMCTGVVLMREDDKPTIIPIILSKVNGLEGLAKYVDFDCDLGFTLLTVKEFK